MYSGLHTSQPLTDLWSQHAALLSSWVFGSQICQTSWRHNSSLTNTCFWLLHLENAVWCMLLALQKLGLPEWLQASHLDDYNALS